MDSVAEERESSTARIGTGSFTARYAGATLLYPFFGLAEAEAILTAAAVGARPTGGAGCGLTTWRG